MFFLIVKFDIKFFLFFLQILNQVRKEESKHTHTPTATPEETNLTRKQVKKGFLIPLLISQRTGSSEE